MHQRYCRNCGKLFSTTGESVVYCSDACMAAKSKEIFDRFADRRFLPFDQIDEDPARAELDEALLVEFLGLPPAVLDSMAEIRNRLAREPQIHGGKKTRVVFDADGGEHSERRSDRG